ncbi:hypothetical protein DKY63_25010 [Pseudomonas putida]|uniref:Uncharacterized protein n=1 Tax=Pseudomonas putida TaxID=303 RepID=A0A2Z4RT25_PSEPU|nr:hypothetical protein [Pseudomonas putida]AWY42994.1 hypothetical protein DKY63_25010 [Pseudomonas putida]
MNSSARCKPWLYRLFGAFILLVSSPGANALVQEITAKFIPDPANPLKNEFVNTTPESGVCPGHIPQRCKDLGIFTIRTAAFAASSNSPILANHEDVRQGAMWKVPSQWRDLQVTHAATGEVETVQVRIAGIGHRWNLNRPPGVSAWAKPGITWNSQWSQAPSPCTGVNYLAASTSFALFFWIVPEGAGICSRQPGMDIPRFWYDNMEYAYAIRTPNPLKMSSGQYTGSINYTMGPGADFDFGDVMIPNDNVFTFNFTLDVQHALKVEVPPGGHRIDLVPQGGWQAWLNQGRKPTRLFRDQTFNISASSRFKMRLECQYLSGNTCALWEPKSGHGVPLNVGVSLPNGLTDAFGQPVNRRPLLRDGSGTELFQPGFYVDRKPGSLHFEIDREHVEQMLTGAEKTYSGHVTVVWDSEV